MIKETIIMVIFGATFVEKPSQPDLQHRNYWPLKELRNGLRAYGNIQVGQGTNTTESYFAATLVTKGI